jgi:aerobic carbon-monoxide dehydrogenase medium subunit
MIALHRPRTVEEALSLLDTLDSPMVYGGGTAIQILMKQGVLFAENLVDLGMIPGLDAVEESPAGFRAGAMVSIRTMERDPRVVERAPLVAATYGKVANPRVRNTASIGGNIAHGDYRLDPPTALLALSADIVVASVRGTRTVPAREFFVDFQQTALEPGEMILAIEIPRQPPRTSAAFAKLSSLAVNDWPVASVAALLDAPTEVRRMLRLGVGALAPTPVFVDVDVSGLDREGCVEAALAAVHPLLDPLPDVRGGVEYKRHLGQVATQEAVEGAWRDQHESH